MAAGRSRARPVLHGRARRRGLDCAARGLREGCDAPPWPAATLLSSASLGTTTDRKVLLLGKLLAAPGLEGDGSGLASWLGPAEASLSRVEEELK